MRESSRAPARGCSRSAASSSTSRVSTTQLCNLHRKTGLPVARSCRRIRWTGAACTVLRMGVECRLMSLEQTLNDEERLAGLDLHQLEQLVGLVEYDASTDPFPVSG